jgi:hypothetical protein
MNVRTWNFRIKTFWRRPLTPEARKLQARVFRTSTFRPVRSWPRRNLPPRKFCPIMRVKLLDLASKVAGKQIVGSDAKHPRNHKKLQIGDAPVLSFQPGDGLPAGIPAKELKFQGEMILRPALAQAQFSHLRANHVQVCGIVFDGPERNRRVIGRVSALLHK